ncbi:MAG: transposase, partial [Trebonia sp.]
WYQAKRKLGRVHARAAAIRSDVLHKATSGLAKTHGQIVIEGLGTRGHMRGAETP